MSNPTIKLVKDDTAPDVDVQLVDAVTGLPINVSNAGDVVRMYFRQEGSSTIKATITATKPNGGADGIVRFAWSAGDLDTAGEFEGEIEITFNTGKIQTIFETIEFSVRADF